MWTSFEPVWTSHSQWISWFQPSPVTTTLRQFQHPGRTGLSQFELVTASFNNQEEPVHNQFEPSPLVRTSLNQFQQPVRTSLSQSQPVSTTRRNWFELVIASEEPVWASHSQVQFNPSPVTTTLRQSQPVSTPRKNQLVWPSFTASFWASFNHLLLWEPVSTSFNSSPVKNQFELASEGPV